MSQTMISVQQASKSFVLHNQGSAVVEAYKDVSFDVHASECRVLTGPSGSGKTAMLRSLYANYKPTAGAIYIQHKQSMEKLSDENPRLVLEMRRETIGYVSQFLRVIPRVTTLDLVAEPLIKLGSEQQEARAKARDLLARLNLPQEHWDLPPASFSGGEQQRVNIARGFIFPYPILLLDEPTASLDAINRQVVVELISEARNRGSAVVGIFHDEAVRDEVKTSELNMLDFK